jgi:hypothetical protein
LNQLFKIISLEMKCRCIDKECQTILEAVDVIERYELIVGEGDRKKSTIRSVRSKDTERPSKNYQGNLQQCFLLACACAFLILKANDSCVLNSQTSGLVYVLTIDMCVYPQVTSSCKMSWLVSSN